MSLMDVFQAGAGLSVTAVTVTPDLIGIAVTPSASTTACPVCGTPSGHVHSHYLRTVADLPWHGRRVVLRVTVRRFRCRNGGCVRTIFCERLPEVLSPHAQTTTRLTASHRVIGFALGGEAGSRLANHLTVPTSPDTLLRRVTKAAPPTAPPPRVLGVDDFAFRRGESYGTILMDLERRVVIDLLPDRAAGTLAAWLKTHPGVEIVSRDRATAYAQATREAAPNATQVADRFHLLMNLRQAVERSLARQSTAVRAAWADPTFPSPTEAATRDDAVPPDPIPTLTPEPPLKEQAAVGARATRQARFEQVRQLHRDGVSLRRIAKSLRLHGRTVQKYVRAESCPVWRSARKGIPAPSPLDPFRPLVEQRITEGCPNARALFRELQTRGYPGGYSPVRKAVHRLTRGDGRNGPRGIPKPILPAPPIRPPIPSARRLSFTVARRGDTRSPEEKDHLEHLARSVTGVTTTVSLAERFAVLVRSRNEPGLDPWLADATASDLPEFRAFAASLRQDEAAVRAGLSLPWSNGPVVGAVNRLKTIKRSMYGRAGFPLLKARVLHPG